jgi:opacity protein-like surface antigen
MKLRRVFALALLLGAARSVAAADSGFYFGVSGGQAKYDFEPLPNLIVTTPIVPFPTVPGAFAPVPRFQTPLNPFIGVPNASFIGTYAEPVELFWIPGDDDEATAWNLLAGYRFFRFAAVELSYSNLGTLHEYQPSRTLLSTIVLPEVRSEMESAGATLSVLGILPITEQWNVFLRAGGLFVDQDVTRTSGGGPKFSESYDSESWLYGIGTQVDFGSHWTVRLDFQRYDDVGKGNGIGEADVDVLALGVLFRL